MTLSIIGNIDPSAAGHEKWVRGAFGLARAEDLDAHIGDDPNVRSVIVVGRDVAEAHGMQRFGLGKHVPLAGHQWRRGSTLFTFCPSPASLATLPDGPAARASLRRVLMAEMVLNCLTLRPWHFRLGDKQTLHDLGVAWCPVCPAAGMAFALFAAEAHRQRVAVAASPLSIAVHAAFPATAEATVTPKWDTHMRGTAWLFDPRRAYDAITNAALVASAWVTTRAAVEAFLPHCPDLTAHDAARGILLRHMMEFST